MTVLLIQFNFKDNILEFKNINNMNNRFQNLRWKTCLEQNCGLGFSEGPALGQNTLSLMIMMMMDSLHNFKYNKITNQES